MFVPFFSTPRVTSSLSRRGETGWTPSTDFVRLRSRAGRTSSGEGGECEGGESEGGGSSTSGEDEGEGKGSSGSSTAGKSTPISSGGSSKSVATYNEGGGEEETIGSEQPFAGRVQGGGTRDEVWVKQVYGSGYPGLSGRGVNGRGFTSACYFWPISWGDGAGYGANASYLYDNEYGGPDNTPVQGVQCRLPPSNVWRDITIRRSLGRRTPPPWPCQRASTRLCLTV
ncbi:hypothetical protein C8F04DRAFT_1097384 [Mycena alexandri]|uniref:Uncharacterized protein n=1 Tax=Mycena alexandri TaxID=1745969 RepID=A0AAD6SZQ5_9AGAR|nr:hypothetical protein C8F04DRAFT_1097384 [Mycena alexandri]